ncbi:MAG: restriction endonuclease subunit S [Deltaproteobacteria bacterium]|nr:restriction endonuclease subunit S [Deltaproteobacteria bacterium]
MTPNGWRQAGLAEIADLAMGETIIAKDLTGDGIPVFSAGRDSAPWGWTSKSRRVFGRGTIVLGARGTIGFPRLPTFERFVSTQTTIAVAPTDAAVSEFLKYALERANFDDITAKQAVPMLTISALRPLSLLLPPLAEQRKIAAILSSVDDAIESTQAVIDQLHVVKKAMMAELLTRGLPGRHTRFKQTEIGEVPEEWEVVRLGSLVAAGSSVTYGVVQPGPEDPAGVRFVRSGDVAAGHLREETLRTITRAVSDQYSRTVLRGGELLVALVGQPGATLVAPQRLAGANIARQVGLIQLGTRVSAEFVCLFLQSPSGLGGMLRETIGSVQQVINLRDLEKILVPAPDACEQRDLVAVVAAIADRQAVEHETLAGLLRIKSALMSVLLTGEVRVTADERAVTSPPASGPPPPPEQGNAWSKNAARP